MKKALTSLTIFVSLVFTTTTPIRAFCVPQTSNGCQPPTVYSCGSQCCSIGGQECQTASEIGQFSQYADDYQNQITTKADVTTIDGIINALLPILLSGAGLILFFMLLSGGFTMLTAVSDPKKAEAGKQRITTAIIGFIIVFAAYWITQLLEIILGVNIL